MASARPRSIAAADELTAMPSLALRDEQAERPRQ